MPLTDVSGKQYHAGYQAILDKYRDMPAVNPDAVLKELQQYQHDFDTFRETVNARKS